jgi:putative solute:sodium symporter small subunit
MRRTVGVYLRVAPGLSGDRARGFNDMMERKERKPYWRHTKWQMLASVVPFLVLIIVLPLYAESLNTERFLGFPLGYFLSAHGIAIIAVFTVASFVNRQDAIDHWHGAHEDN